ncbi:AraC family transcriptional regulator [Paenibacillus rhizosphaerae]|uniref:AraC family transcriptional regulator n=1 Tax=Paenibacillus rhizosphaerae TaxID=297318 RepID=A0A839TSN9_9BACL|nr:AraC family transcriptional regulator [Paenibacillus rhizosphaerae]MBB3128670.1 AraC family transcriptional regulator [Paenibacillus rhizosphaerae]
MTLKSDGMVWSWLDSKARYMSNSKPVLDSQHLGWKYIHFSKWEKVGPQEGYIEAMPNYLITMHTSPQPIKTLSRFDGCDYERVMKTGEANCFVPGNFDYFRWEKVEASYSCILLSPSLVHDVACQLDMTFKCQDELTNKLSIYDSKLVQLSQWLMDEVNGNGARGKLYIESLSNLMAQHLLEIIANPSKQPYISRNLTDRQISRVIEYMHVHYDRDISLEELAKVVNFSQTQLNRMFKQSTGLSPYQYFIHLRIDKAKTLIKSREFTIGEIAVMLGFVDQSHLNRHFKKITGLSPGEYMSS